ncbi:epoxide hydrolase family protein [Streptomyces sp. CB01881]|uniref:epoxide hydrolase family protein n=1 Tax=Streptomyces sp. CB01881 TaxID=2078691 RepID=UPI000CDCC824|nr:epoxide hydrolase family protein [Streptomyces sp. CB01881]AUY48047.1 epoxide hydrolase [Streptomyces sp. CB01881]TYC76527.1 epoxide hydrolase [Streptomyces sp. CB01881]
MTLPFSPVTDSALDDLHRRLAATRRPLLARAAGWERGADADFLARLLDSWRERYDWRAHEARILDLPWETVGSGDRALHLVHQRAAADAPVVVLLHGWPDSVLRFERVLPLLEDLNVVVPALPGFPFSHESARPGMTTTAMASLVTDATRALGYGRYVVSGGDVGADVAEQLAAMHPDRVAALHLTNVSPLHAVFADRSALGAEELAYLDTAAAWQRAEGGYIAQQSTKPHTLAPALADSPAGLGAWICEKLWSWSHIPFEEEVLLTWISVYWFTNTIGTSFTPYAEVAPPVPYVATPTVLSAFSHDTKPAPRCFASRFVNVREFIEHENGGHFAAWEQPLHYAEDLRRAVGLADW